MTASNINLKPKPRVTRLFRPTDVTIINGAANIRFEGKLVPAVFATPDRAVARLRRDLKIANTDNIPLPYISITRTNIAPDQTRYIGYPWRAHYLRMARGGKAKEIGKPPIPYNLDYQISFWDRYRWRLNDIVETYLDRFIPTQRILIDFGPPWGVFECNVTLNSVDDASELEPGEEADRKLRMNVSISVETWLVRSTEWVPTMLEGHTTYRGVENEVEDLSDQTPEYIDDHSEVLDVQIQGDC